MILRLDKYLADMGIGTRSEIKKAILKNQVQVNGKIERNPGHRVDTETDLVIFQGNPVVYLQYEYFMLNKPAGVVSATKDKKDRTVLDFIGENKRNDLFPVGRLDKDTEGLLLITNDGQLSHQLLSPKKHVDKVYFARIDGIVTDEDRQAFLTGVDIGDERPTLPAELEILKSDRISEIRLTIREGRFHQVKRMFLARGKQVLYLKREKMGGLSLDSALRPGQARRLTKEEVDRLC